MQTAVFESTFPVMGALKWHKQYHAMLATPLRSTDALVGHLLFVVFRLATTAAVFLLVMAPFGVFASVTGTVLAVLVALLVGMAFATPVYGLSAGLKDTTAFAVIYRVGIIPMFLFSGAFFPVANLPDSIEWIARITPLWHGVDLTRMLTLGHVETGPALVHLAYLLALAGAGAWWSVHRLTRRLVV
jgi:lipooligosaccharide transport system permease protein